MISCSCAAAGARGTPSTPPADRSITISPAELFELADRARLAKEFSTAEGAYRALMTNPDDDIRTEAQFRYAMMLADDQQRYRDAAVIFRRILDEKPDVARVRLELARMLAMTGNLGDAQRQFRAAEAAGLPPEVQQLVRFYANALSARRPFGGSLELSLAPDNNINRATRSDTVGTVIGNFTLDENARARSGIGLDARGQLFWREGLEKNSDLLVRASAAGTLYRDSAFNDISMGLQAGPQYRSGRDLIALSGGISWRWYGMKPFTVSVGVTTNWQHPTGKRSQLSVEGGISHVSNQRNALQTADRFSLSANIDRSFTSRFGGGLQFYGFREVADDPGYSLASGGTGAYLFGEVGRTTLVASVGYSRLEGDQRLFLYPKRRIEDRYSASIAATLRALRVGTFAPLVRLKWERNRSSLEIYDYQRVAAEFGISSAF